jgi:hypothetical protein
MGARVQTSIGGCAGSGAIDPGELREIAYSRTFPGLELEIILRPIPPTLWETKE